ncbi:MAG TPA: helix-turn-helix domain-containing protein [Thermomicrobiales bacterium]|jgi:DNA-binding transcriptional MerR regulator|nr:helix-turn-helix domain-containing protein [Thermomicrobiales bacterium]HQZ89850.1 helix-turn-helix domain-containing protein [Thermomicrobiales bacterium]HRA30892.1 helix-turn-helix domain-containing protein [Thermomicrobiales bacterium]
MQAGEPRFSLAELEESSGLNTRTIRFYIEQGLVPPALGRGRSRYFTPDHLRILAEIAHLRDQRLSLNEIRARLTIAATPTQLDSEEWRRLRLHPDLELHVRAGAPEGILQLAARITALAAEWIGDDEIHPD